MRAVRVRSRHFNGRQPNGLNKNISVIRLRDKSSSGAEGGGGGGGAYARDKNTSAGLCAKNAGGASARGGAYLRDTTVLTVHHQPNSVEHVGVLSCLIKGS